MDAFPAIANISFTALDDPPPMGVDAVQAEVSPQATVADFMSLLEWLPEDRELSFFDQYFPSISDPGAYVSIRRRGALFSHFMGNHGWSRDWSLQSPELLARWLHMNLRPRFPHGEALKRVELRLLSP